MTSTIVFINIFTVIGWRVSQHRTRSGSVLTGLIPPAATNSSFSRSRSKSRLRPQGQKCWYKCIIREVLSKGIDMCNIKAQSLLVQKLWSRLSFFKSRSKVKVKVIRSKFLVWTERSCHKEYIPVL